MKFTPVLHSNKPISNTIGHDDVVLHSDGVLENYQSLSYLIINAIVISVLTW